MKEIQLIVLLAKSSLRAISTLFNNYVTDILFVTFSLPSHTFFTKFYFVSHII